MEYPFKKAKEVEKSRMVDFLTASIKDHREGSRKRIRSSIRDAHIRTKSIEIKIKGSKEFLIIPDFFKWAFKKWPELSAIDNIPKLPIQGKFSSTTISRVSFDGSVDYSIPDDIDELKQKYIDTRHQVDNLTTELGECKKKNLEMEKELSELRDYREKRFNQNRENASKSKGVPKSYK